MHRQVITKLYLITLLGLMALAGTVNAQDIEYERITVGAGNNLRWSPDGKYLSFTGGIKGGYLYIYHVETGVTTQIGTAPTFRYDWLSNDKLIFNRKEWVRKEKHRIVELSTMSLNGNTTIIESDTLEERSRDMKGRFSLRRLSNGQVLPLKPVQNDFKKLISTTSLSTIDTSSFYVIKNNPIWSELWGQAEHDGDLYLVKPDGSMYKRITFGQGYIVPWLSPNGEYICALGGGITIFNHEGDIVGKINGFSSFASWLSNNKRLVFERIESGGPDGQELAASELYIADYTGENEIQITYTPDIIEHEPTVSPDDSMIAYINYLTYDVEILKIVGGL